MNRSGGGHRSRSMFRIARGVLPGGVDSPVRSFRAVGGSPVFFHRGAGAYLVDVDGRRYLDLVNSWGATLLGHAPAGVVNAVVRAARRGLSFGAPTPAEHRLAERIRRDSPVLERLRFVNSGTEATMSAIRVARGFTGRATVLKFAGAYHGHSDGLLASAGSGVGTHALPDSAGVPTDVVRNTRVVPYNDLGAVEEVLRREPEGVAAVIVEPIAANMGLVPPVRGFLAGLERLCRAHGTVLIADEVITGYRLRKGAAYPRLGFTPDLVTLGKVIGGGLPVGAYGGRRRIMSSVAPDGPVYQAGTLAGNPLTMAAGAAVLDAVSAITYRHLDGIGRELEDIITDAAAGSTTDGFHLQRVGSMMGLFFTGGPVVDFAGAQRTDRLRYAGFFHEALRRGVYLPPSPLETAFLSAATTSRDIARTVSAWRAAFRAARGRPR